MVTPDVLKKLKVFRDVSPVALEHLAKSAITKNFLPGDIICREGDKGAALYLIVSGSVAVEKKLVQEGNATKIVARLGAEEFFGEMAFLQNQPHSATVSALEETVVLLLSRASLNELSENDPKIALDQILTVMTGLSDRLRSTTRELVTVFEVARVVAAAPSAIALAKQVVEQLHMNLPPSITIGFYRWNPFNDEYSLLCSSGSLTEFSQALEPSALTKMKNSFYPSLIESPGMREGMLLFNLGSISSFSSGEKQMIETVSAVLAPALATARFQEEEEARRKLLRTKQEGSYL